MKGGRKENGKKQPVSGSGAAALCILLPIVVLLVLKTNFLPQVTRIEERTITEAADGSVHKVSSSGLESSAMQQQLVDVAKKRLKAAHDSVIGAPPPPPASTDETAAGVVEASRDAKIEKESFLAMNGGRDGSLVNSDVAAPRSKLSCNFSSIRTNICSMDGDIRMHGKAAAVYVVSATDESNRTVTIRPFPRKWEMRTMKLIREVTIRSSAPGATDDAAPPPRCTVRHDVPAVVFSTPVYSSNFYHGMTDLVVPLFNSAQEYNGRVQLVAANYDRKWIAKYRHIISALSIYPVIDFDADDAVRCFPAVQVGLNSHKDLGIIPALSRKGYTMMDFRDFLRSAYSLKRAWATPVNRAAGARPRLVMLLRRHSRALTNEAEAVAAAREVGFEVVAAGPESVGDMAQFAEVVNSCDVMVGVHGAGLTNMVFLPHNGTLMQIVPWGMMKWPCWIAFGEPTPEMALRYVEYEANAGESTLKEIYPKDHALLTDPQSIHDQGFSQVWKYYLDGQNVTLDIDRFRGVMQEIYLNVTIS